MLALRSISFRSLSQDCSGVEIALRTRHHIRDQCTGDALSDRAPHKVKLDDTIADSLKGCTIVEHPLRDCDVNMM